MKKIEIKEENILIILFSFYNIMLLFKQKQKIIYNIQNCQILKHLFVA